MTRSAVWIAALFASALGASAAHAQSLTLTSPDIKEGGTIATEQIITGFGCVGGNISPGVVNAPFVQTTICPLGPSAVSCIASLNKFFRDEVLASVGNDAGVHA